jgi:hypothetical protein
MKVVIYKQVDKDNVDVIETRTTRYNLTALKAEIALLKESVPSLAEKALDISDEMSRIIDKANIVIEQERSIAEQEIIDKEFLVKQIEAGLNG